VWSLLGAYLNANYNLAHWAGDKRYEPQRKLWRMGEKQQPGWYDHHVNSLWDKMFFMNFASRCWVAADVYFALTKVPSHASSIRVAAALEVLACVLVEEGLGTAVWQALGVGSMTACMMFALGGLGLYSGRLAGTVGDRRLFGLKT
jgi:hypothetical protein